MTIDRKIIIEQIKKRPELYQKNLKQNVTFKRKKEIWEEICGEIIPNWSKFDKRERRNQAQQVRRQWKNLRLSFYQEWKVRKRNKQASSEKSKSEIFEELAFIHPTKQKKSKEEVDNKDNTVIKKERKSEISPKKRKIKNES